MKALVIAFFLCLYAAPGHAEHKSYKRLSPPDADFVKAHIAEKYRLAAGYPEKARLFRFLDQIYRISQKSDGYVAFVSYADAATPRLQCDLVFVPSLDLNAIDRVRWQAESDWECLGVKATSFADIDQDGRIDILTLYRFRLGSGRIVDSVPVIYRGTKRGFVYDRRLSEFAQANWTGKTIAALKDYISQNSGSSKERKRP